MGKDTFKDCPDNEQKDMSETLAEMMFGELIPSEEDEKLPPKNTGTKSSPQE